jgi:hypothetical protein
VVVGVGAAYETITVQATWFPPEDAREDAPPPLVQARRTEHGDVHVVVDAAAGEAATRGRVSIRCEIPPRFCGVSINSGGGDVRVDSVVEASVDVRSDGGNVVFGSIRGAAVRVASEGGDVVARNVAADASVDTGGGFLKLEKLIGRRVRARTGGGLLSADAVYVSHLDVDTRGGSCALGETRLGAAVRDGARRAASRLKTRGGFFSARGFACDVDAVVSVETSGGDCELELRTGTAGYLCVRTKGGDVSLGVPESFFGKIDVTGLIRGGKEFVANASVDATRDFGDFGDFGSVGSVGSVGSSETSFANPFVTSVPTRAADVSSAATARLVGGANDWAARKVAAGAFASRIAVDASRAGTGTRREVSASVETPRGEGDEDGVAAVEYAPGLDPFEDDEDDLRVAALLDALEEDEDEEEEDAAAAALGSGDVVLRRRSWIASLGLGKRHKERS